MMRKYGYILLLILFLAIVQPALLSSIGITVYMIDLVAIVVAAQAFTRNLTLSAGIAIYAGVLVDLFAPNAQLIGISSIGYLVVAILVNRYAKAPHNSPWRPVFVAASAPAIVVVIRALVIFITGQPINLGQLPAAIGSQLIASLIFAAFLVPLIDILDRPLYRDSLPLRVR